jgi:thiol-disulfide isomerase/thioredoxin
MMKKVLVGIVVALLLTVGVFALFSSNDDMNNMEAKDAMISDDMSKENDMAKEDDMAADELKKDELKKDEMKDHESDKAMKDEMQVMNDGDMAPEFKLISINDEMVTLSELKGKKVYVKFWASWCSICLAGLDELEELSMSEDIMVYTVVSPGNNGEQDKDEFIEWFNGLGYKHIKVLLDESGDVMKEFGIRGFPTSAYIGSDGVLVYLNPGHASNESVLETFSNIK